MLHGEQPTRQGGPSEVEGHACHARRSGIDDPTLRNGPDKRVPPKSGPDKQVPPKSGPDEQVPPKGGRDKRVPPKAHRTTRISFDDN